ncbi:hypothetical protein Tco_0109907, partial [Tanacetum coccineum]
MQKNLAILAKQFGESIGHWTGCWDRETIGSPVVQRNRDRSALTARVLALCKGMRKLQSVLKFIPYHKDKDDDVQTSIGSHITVVWQRFRRSYLRNPVLLFTIRTVQNNDENNVFANERRHSEQPESINDTYVLEKDDSNIPYDTSDPVNRFCPNREDTVTLEKESRSKMNKDTVKPYDYTYQNSLYEIFKPPSKTYLDQLERAKEVRKTMWRKTFLRTKPNVTPPKIRTTQRN